MGFAMESTMGWTMSKAPLSPPVSPRMYGFVAYMDGRREFLYSSDQKDESTITPTNTETYNISEAYNN